MTKKSTSWQPVSKWYHKSVGSEGHFYHQTVVIPQTLDLLQLDEGASLLDLACGQGVLARHLPNYVDYEGVDISSDLIRYAKKADPHPHHRYSVGDITKPLPLKKRDFSHATILLALQNIEFPHKALNNVADHLQSNGRLVIVLNHPCFRIPRQSSWGIDDAKKTQYRRIDRYLTPLRIPIIAHPSQKNSVKTWSFHQPLSYYCQTLHQAGFMIETMVEWTSTKTSKGAAAIMENRSRTEFPLFLTIVAVKK